MKYPEWKRKFVDTNAAAGYNEGVGGVVKLGTKRNNAAKDYGIHQHGYVRTEFNPKADYSIQISGLSDDVNYGLSDACRNVAEKGSVTGHEALDLVSLTDGKRVYHEIGTDDEVGGDDFWEFLRANPNSRLAFVHNHPTDSFLSSTDLQTFAGNKQIQIMISTSNDGLKRVLYGDTKQEGILLYDYYKNDLDALREKVRKGLIEPADYSSEMEKMLIENAIRDFANLGFWEVDGRV
jgi:hypothetical protein